MALRWIFSADSRPYRRGLDQMRTETKAFGRAVTRTMAGVFSAAAIVAGFRSWFQHMDRLDKAAKKLGASVEDLQKTAVVAEKNNVSLDQLTNLLVRLKRRFGEAAAGSETYRQKLESLGLSAQKLQNAQPSEFLIALSAAWIKATGSATQYSDLLGLLDSEARELIAALQEGPEALAAAIAKANAVGEKTVGKMAAINDQLTDIKNNVNVGFGYLAIVIDLLLKNVGASIGGIITLIRNWIDLIKNGLAGALRSLNGLFTANLSEMKAGIADITSAVDESIRKTGRQMVQIAAETKDAWHDAFSSIQKDAEEAAQATNPLAGQIFGGSPFDPSVGARARAQGDRIRLVEDMAGRPGFDLATRPKTLAEFLKDRPLPFDEAETFARQLPTIPVTSLRSIGGNIGGGGNITGDNKLVQINSLQLATLQIIARNTEKNPDGSRTPPEPRVP